jgi:hypothetical protein
MAATGTKLDDGDADSDSAGLGGVVEAPVR